MSRIETAACDNCGTWGTAGSNGVVIFFFIWNLLSSVNHGVFLLMLVPVTMRK